MRCEKESGPCLFRILIGGVTYDDNGEVHFVQDCRDHFPDHAKAKWLCYECAEELEIYVDELDFDVCRAPEAGSVCGRTFQPAEEDDSESVIRIEWGVLRQNSSDDKGSDEYFVPSEGGHVHYWCLAEAYEFPLHTIPYVDEPVFDDGDFMEETV
jgi:hypothetical protein